jgi:hypothetical protein
MGDEKMGSSVNGTMIGCQIRVNQFQIDVATKDLPVLISVETVLIPGVVISPNITVSCESVSKVLYYTAVPLQVPLPISVPMGLAHFRCRVHIRSRGRSLGGSD